MKSIVSRSFLLPVIAAAIILCISSRASAFPMPDSAGPCLTVPNSSIIINAQAIWSEFDTTIILANASSNTIVFGGVLPLSGDTGIIQFWPNSLAPTAITILPGQAFGLDIVFSLRCPATKSKYSEIFDILSGNGTVCSTDTITVYTQFPITDSIALNVPAILDTIGIAPFIARSEHILDVTKSSINNIFLDSITITGNSNIAYFGQPGDETFVFNDSLLAGQVNDAALLTLYPSDTGTQDIGLLLHYNNSTQTQPYTIQFEVSHNSLNGYPVLGRSVLFRNLRLNQEHDSEIYFINEYPDTITITQWLITGDYQPGLPWSIDTNGPFLLRLPVKLPPEQHVAIRNLRA